MSNNEQYTYAAPQGQPVIQTAPKKNGVAIAALICGIAAFFINPLSAVSLAAIILGIVGMVGNKPNKGTAVWGLILGIASSIAQFVVDLVITFLLGGFGFFAFFI